MEKKYDDRERIKNGIFSMMINPLKDFEKETSFLTGFVKRVILPESVEFNFVNLCSGQ
jgi:hypothetical protein